MNKLDIIEVLLGTYRVYPKNRALEFGIIPRIRTSDGKLDPIGCAMLVPEEYEDVMGGFYAIIKEYRARNPYKLDHLSYPPKGLFHPRWDGHHCKFWYELQKFHDTNIYYTDTGLSLQGMVALKQLQEKWTPSNSPVK